MAKKYNILVVDDTIKNLQLLCCLLQENTDYLVNVARNGVEALDIVQKINFDVILLDINMPVMDGYETCQKLKTDAAYSHIPIIFLTAQSDQKSIFKAFEYGAVDYLVKPFNGQELTMRVKTQLELKAHRDNLELLVEERTSKLAKALEDLKKSSKIKDEFLATMSHEMRTPMNGIMGLSSLLAAEDLSVEQSSYVHNIQKSLSQLQFIVDNLFEYTFLESSEASVTEQETVVVDFINEVAEATKAASKEKGLDFILFMADNLPNSVAVDSWKLTKALSQLLDNALKFTNEGFIQFSVDITGAGDGQNLVFEVSDSGIGISESDFEKIFDKFTQVDSSATRNYEGVGIGLALSQKLVKVLGGKIDIQSELGIGSTFKIQVPFKPSKSTEVVPEKAVHVVRSSKIMIVEDNKTNQLLTKRIDKKMGHEAILAENGLVALQLLKSNKPDLILMDCMMPQMDGYEATRLIRAGSDLNDLPIIALTANTLEDDKEKCLAAGMDDYMPKPLNVTQLKIVFSKFLG
ncbi:MAG: response regulator [Lentisphaerales bacterium]|nr:response regulator [Lentisphaerales bacterium]